MPDLATLRQLAEAANRLEPGPQITDDEVATHERWVRDGREFRCALSPAVVLRLLAVVEAAEGYLGAVESCVTAHCHDMDEAEVGRAEAMLDLEKALAALTEGGTDGR